MTAPQAPLSLGRNDTQLGEVVASLPTHTADVVYGLFRPTPAFVDVGDVMQVRAAHFPGTPVYLSRFTSDHDPGPKNLRQMTPEEAAGLPAPEQLMLRDSEGRALETDMIAIHGNAVPDAVGPWPDLCRAHGIAGHAWVLMAKLTQPTART